MTRSRIAAALIITWAAGMVGPSEAQVQIEKFSGPSTAGMGFGCNVAVTPDGVWVAGATRNGDVHVYHDDGSGFALDAVLTSSSPLSSYEVIGADVAISDDGSVLAIGEAGGAIVYRRAGATWFLDGTVLSTSSGSVFDNGVALSADGTVLAVSGGDPATIGVRVYRHDGSAWIEEWSSAGTGAVARTLGVDFDENAGRLIAGMPSYAVVGAAMVFAYDGVTWVQEALLANPEPATSGLFGERVALEGNTAVVGTWANSTISYTSGAAQVFEYAGGTWGHVQKLTPNTVVCSIYCWHGSDVDLRGDHLLVRTPGIFYQDAYANAGAASLYRRGVPSAGEPPWVFVTRIFNDEPVFAWTTGTYGSCALSDGRAVIGLSGDWNGLGNGAGTVRVFDLEECIENAIVDGVGGGIAGVWTPIGCGTVTEEGGALTFSSAGGCAYVGAMSDRRELLLCGDFDVSVGWCLEEWPLPIAPNARRGVYLAVNRANNDDHENTLAAIGRVDNWAPNKNCFTTTGQYLGWFNTIGLLRGGDDYYWLGPDPCNTTLWTQPAPTTATSGAFRITRSGATIALHYRDTGGWVELASQAIDDTSVSVQVWAGSDGEFSSTVGDPAPFTVRIGDPANPCAPADTDPPAVTITSPMPDAVFGAASATLVADVADDSATTVSSTPAGVAPGALAAGGGTVSGPVPLATEGANVLSVHATDEHGNGGGASVTVYRDTVAPALAVAPTEGMVLGVAPVELLVAVVDQTLTLVDTAGAPLGTLAPAGGVVHGVVDGSLTSILPLVEGPNVFTVTAVDAAGNSTTVVRTLVLDSTAPLVTIDDPLNGQWFAVTPIPLVATIDDSSDVTVSGQLSALVPAGGGIVPGTAGLVEGWNELSVTGTDVVGNSSTASVSVLLDTTPPVVAIVSPLAGAVLKGTVDYHATADDPSPGSGLAGVALRVDGAPHAAFAGGPYEALLDTTLLADGWHTLVAVATDGLGHQAQHAISVLVDNTPPTVAITDPAPGAWIAGDIAFSAFAADTGSGLVALQMWSGGAVPAVTDGSTTYATPVAADVRTSVDLAPATDGSWTLAAHAVDAAGNEAHAEITVFTDNSAPDKAILAPADGAVVSGTVPIEVAVADPNLAWFELRVDGAVVAVETGATSLVYAYDTTQRPDGPMTVALDAFDTLGNSSTCSITVAVDNTGGCVEIHPEVLNLKSKGKQNSITVQVCGYGLEALLPTEAAGLRLIVPGGSSVPSTAGFSGDDQVQGGPGELQTLLLKFDRQLLISSIKAGIQSGAITGDQVTLVLKAGDQVLGSDEMKLVGGI